MRRYQCIRDILDCYDFYEKYAIGIDRARWFRGRIYGWTPSSQIARPVGLCSYETRLSVFRRVVRAYVFRAVREGRSAGLDYLTICYALCRKISAAVADQGYEDPVCRFSMAAYARMLRGDEMKSCEDMGMEDPCETSARRKIAFLRDEKIKRSQQRESFREQSGFHIEFP